MVSTHLVATIGGKFVTLREKVDEYGSINKAAAAMGITATSSAIRPCFCTTDTGNASEVSTQYSQVSSERFSGAPSILMVIWGTFIHRKSRRRTSWFWSSIELLRPPMLMPPLVGGCQGVLRVLSHTRRITGNCLA